MLKACLDSSSKISVPLQPMGSCGYAFSSGKERRQNIPSVSPLPSSSMQRGFLLQYLKCFGASLAWLSCYRKGTVCRALCYPGVCSFLCVSDQGDERRGHRELFPQHSSAMTSDPDLLPSPRCAGQLEAGGAPLALAFPFVCVALHSDMW